MPTSALTPPPSSSQDLNASAGQRFRWLVFCRVIDNLGDIGVCWRLCRNLADHGIEVELWIDVPDDLQWMAPGALDGNIPYISVRHWTEPLSGEANLIAANAPQAQVWIEAFGCNPPAECTDALASHVAAGGRAPVWLNLEYMSAESYVERCHRLPSPIMTGPLVGITKHFFYPGFTPRTGGLLREKDLLQRQADFDSLRWVRSRLNLGAAQGKRAVMFCYAPPAMAALLTQWNQGDDSVECLVTPGWARNAVLAATGNAPLDGAQLRLHPLPYVTQPEFDQLLWSSDFNFVRGEDSLVRALWAGKPFVWQIYPQDDNAHHAKLEAFLDWLDAPESWRRFHRQWNAIGDEPLQWPGWDEVQTWQATALTARGKLLEQRCLAAQLILYATTLGGRTPF